MWRGKISSTFGTAQFFNTVEKIRLIIWGLSSAIRIKHLTSRWKPEAWAQRSLLCRNSMSGRWGSSSSPASSASSSLPMMWDYKRRGQYHTYCRACRGGGAAPAHQTAQPPPRYPWCEITEEEGSIKGTVHMILANVADPGCLSQIPDPNFSIPVPDPGSKRHRIPDPQQRILLF